MINNNENLENFHQAQGNPTSNEIPNNPPNLSINTNELTTASPKASEIPTKKKIDKLMWIGVVLAAFSLVLAVYLFLNK